MPITKITIENFKGIGERVEIPLRPITLLFGANSAGKSTVLQAMLFLRELLELQNSDADVLSASGKAINLGGFQQFVHGHDLSRSVRIGVTVSVDDDGLPVYTVESDPEDPTEPTFKDQPLPGIKTAGIAVHVCWHSGTMRPYITRYEVEVNDLFIGAIEAEPPPLIASLSVNEDHPIFSSLWPDADASAEHPRNYDGLGNEIVSPLGYWSKAVFEVGTQVIPRFGSSFSTLKPSQSDESVFLTLSDANRLFSHIFIGSGELVLTEIQRIRYIGPIRSVPERNFASQRSPSESRWADGVAAWDLLHQAHELPAWFNTVQIQDLGLGYRIENYRYFTLPAECALGAALERAQMGFDASIAEMESIPPSDLSQIEAHSRVRMVAEETSIEVAVADIGVGVAQVLPVVIGVMAPGYSVLSVEQPELHLHPAVQCRLGDVFIRAINQSGERLILLETHSEHLMLRLMRRMRETASKTVASEELALRSEHIQVLFVEIYEGRTVMRQMPLNSRGEWVKSWPGGFFDEDINEIF